MARKPKETLLADCMGRPIESKEKTLLSNEAIRTKKSLLRRAKNSERNNARWLTENDGHDPRFKGLATSTGRIGHITNIQADILSDHYLGENKNEIIPVKWLRYWQLICSKATDWGKNPILIFDPSNRDVVDYRLPNMHIISPDRHKELLRKEKLYDTYVSGKENKND